MKVVSLIACLLFTIAAFAQPTKEEILKFKIKKALERRIDPEALIRQRCIGIMTVRVWIAWK